MKPMRRNPWTKPMLVILCRSMPEESVLTACKMTGIQDGPFSHFARCGGTDDTCNKCNDHDIS